MKSITIHKLDDDLGERLGQMAKRDGVSLNQLVKRLLRKSVGLDSPRPDHREEFSDLFGTWTEEEADAFNKRLKDFDQIDEEEW